MPVCLCSLKASAEQDSRVQISPRTEMAIRGNEQPCALHSRTYQNAKADYFVVCNRAIDLEAFR